MPGRHRPRAVPAPSRATGTARVWARWSPAPLLLPLKSHTREPHGRTDGAAEPSIPAGSVPPAAGWHKGTATGAERHALLPRSSPGAGKEWAEPIPFSPGPALPQTGPAADACSYRIPSRRDAAAEQAAAGHGSSGPPRTDRPSRLPPPQHARKLRHSSARPSPAPFRSRPGGRGARRSSRLTHRGAEGRSGGRTARAAPPRHWSPPAARAGQEAGGAQNPAPAAAPHARGRPGALRWRRAAAPRLGPPPAPRCAPPARCPPAGLALGGPGSPGGSAQLAGAEGVVPRVPRFRGCGEGIHALPPSGGTGKQQHGKQIPAAVYKETETKRSPPGDRKHCKLPRANSLFSKQM